MTNPIKLSHPIGVSMSRRGFLSALAIGATRAALGAEDPPTHYGRSEDAQEALAKMSAQGKVCLDPHHNTLPAQWPKNTVVYPSNIQERVSVMEEDEANSPGVGAVTHKVADNLKDPRYGSLYEAIQPLAKGFVAKSYGSYFPLLPLLPPKEAAMRGWVKSQNGQKERYVLLISGEGDTSKAIQDHLRRRLKENPRASHHTDENFADYLMDQTNTNLILEYRNKLREEARFQSSLKLMRETLARVFQVPDNKESVLIDDETETGKMPQTNEKTRVVMLHSPNAAQVAHVFKNWLAPLQKANADLLIYFNGHGEIAKPHPTQRNQGADEGQIYLRGGNTFSTEPVKENQWKQWFNQYVSKFGHVAFMLDSCHSGSFYALNTRPGASQRKSVQA